MEAELMSLDLSDAQFAEISQMMYKISGVKLQAGKEVLVKARLAKRLRSLKISNFDSYMDYLKEDKSGQELLTMIDSLTTNKTSFFRESQHFTYLSENIVPSLLEQGGKIRIWSAGCSSGEEPYTLAIVLREAIKNIDKLDVKILATDISTDVLGRAKQAVYSHETLLDMPQSLLYKYFTCIETKPVRLYRANDSIRSMVSLARLNLMGQWPMSGPFDAIFCRNVMIYFDKPTQQNLINRYWELLAPGGHLFVGHSESLTSTAHNYKYVQPAVYVK